MGKVYPYKASFSLYLRTIQADQNPKGPMKAAAQETLWGSQYLPSIAGAGKSGTRFANMAEFPRCNRMASLPQRCLTASSSSCPDWRASAAPSLSTSLTATSWHPGIRVPLRMDWKLTRLKTFLPFRYYQQKWMTMVRKSYSQILIAKTE
jgi:hypothetical protein